ncbi:MAG: formylglycine-generating enzyme family protein [Minicystis sp.]
MRAPQALLLATSLIACSSERAAPERAAAALTAESAALAPAPSPPVGLAAGPCQGQAVGARVCEGARLLRCEGGAGAGAVEKTCVDIERCDAEQGTCQPACPAGEVYVPATGAQGFVMGKGFLSGSTHAIKGHQPNSDKPHKVVLTRPFCMDALEVTAGEIQPCMDAGACQRPNFARRFVTYPTKPDQPVNAIEWRSAKHYCERLDKSLPSEAQWEWAATGGDGRAYPWGDAPADCEHADFTPGVLPTPAADAGCHGGGPSKVGSHPAGDRVWPSGHIHDLAGNVWEWCLDNYRPYGEKDEVDPVHLETETGYHAVRGGGWNRSAMGIHAAFRGSSIYTYQVPGLGFRCVRNVKAEPHS